MKCPSSTSFEVLLHRSKKNYLSHPPRLDPLRTLTKARMTLQRSFFVTALVAEALRKDWRLLEITVVDSAGGNLFMRWILGARSTRYQEPSSWPWLLQRSSFWSKPHCCLSRKRRESHHSVSNRKAKSIQKLWFYQDHDDWLVSMSVAHKKDGLLSVWKGCPPDPEKILTLVLEAAKTQKQNPMELLREKT